MAKPLETEQTPERRSTALTPMSKEPVWPFCTEEWMNSEEGRKAFQDEIKRHNALPKIYTVT